MPHPVFTKALKEIRSYAIITLGLALYSFAYTAVVAPADFVGGGASGIAMIIYYATGGADGGIPIGYSFFVINAILVTAASFIIGPRFGAKTIYAIACISVLMSVMQKFVPPDLLGLSQDKLLSAILGGAIAAAGISMCFSQGGSSGGTDIIAMIINKYRNISYGRILMACDTVIIGSSFFLFKDVSVLIYGYVLVGIFGYTLDAIIAGNKQSSQIFIMSKKYEQIADRIAFDVKRGVTVLDGSGWYSKKPQKVLMVVCRKTDTQAIYKVIKEVDPEAFITVGSVMGVYGQGFEVLRTK